MGRVHWIGGEKGGVGKSVVARLLAQYWIDRGVSWTGFDTDRSHGALLRHYAGYASAIEIDRLEDLDRIVDALEGGSDEVVVDLAAQSEAALRRWLESGDVVSLLADLGHESWFWYVVDDGKDSVQLLGALLDRLGREERIVCVLNEGRGRDFALFDESKLRNAIEQRGGAVIELPALHSASMRAIDHHDKSFWAAIHHEDPAEGALPLAHAAPAREGVRRAGARRLRSRARRAVGLALPLRGRLGAPRDRWVRPVRSAGRRAPAGT